jgi:hypothetical protein
MTNETLKRGDCFMDGAPEQYQELLEIEKDPKTQCKDYAALCARDKGIVFSLLKMFNRSALYALKDGRNDPAINPHTFDEFKQKCINTFRISAKAIVLLIGMGLSSCNHKFCKGSDCFEVVETCTKEECNMIQRYRLIGRSPIMVLERECKCLESRIDTVKIER